MDIKSFGCSFIYGSELSDDGHGTKYATPSRLTWPSLLAKHYGLEYQCYAYPGAGNLQIMEKVLNQTANLEPALFVIGWTYIDRFDYTANNDNRWQTIKPLDDTALAYTYYKELHSEYRDKLVSLMNIRLTIDTLRAKQLPFIMTYIDDLLFDDRWHSSPAVTDLQEYVSPYMTEFDGQNFLAWSQRNGYPIGKVSHPLEQAHRSAADYMIKVFDKQKIIGC